MKKLNIKVEVVVYVECKKSQIRLIESIIEICSLNSREYNLDINGYIKNTNNETEFHIVMKTEGSYESNLVKLRHLHMSMEELFNHSGIKYKGISIIPNQVKWN